MKKMTVAVIFGGFSSEYDVSLQSAYSIIKAMEHGEYEPVPIGITREGIWYRYLGDIEKLPDNTWHTDKNNLKSAIISPSRGEGLLVFDGGRFTPVPVDAVFPVLHGKCGEDGTVQGLCELAGLPLVGCGSAASALCMDKDRAHKIVSLSGIRVPKSICFEHPPADGELLSAVQGMTAPVFIKPVKAGSSLGITMTDDFSKLPEAVRAAFMFDDAVIIEERIEGFEVGCAVVGNDTLTVGRADEIELSSGFFDFMEKYTLKTSKIHMPARIDAETERRVTEAAKTIYRALGCRGYSRVDMFLTPDNEIVFNEVNTIPGFTSHSRFPNMMHGVGVEYPKLVDILIGLSLKGRTDEGI